ncbi:phosphoribosyltransferase-like protein [Syncephalis pseudoplumigaleata]|uniref:ribose-phosphate diphosphokinase n=1 Tax=Syncephalis pseudoplumigaleata TaxID=1712513 RepID=A0A4P9YYT3_9FUNG|nr:phosphoribosyltransferase-like protein [Syncephalis pseudoplumigaleata]|eukprot:RKP25267.1 phosphoribosyltransferase-like protein [Syncephalis pseudoplumigaleata]
MRRTKIFAGSSHPELSRLISQRLGHPLSSSELRSFANHETSVQLGVSVRNEDVFIIQSGSDTVNDHLMELLIMVNACKGASASRITAVIPYFPYAKQCKRKKRRGAIAAKLVANMLAVAGVNHIITMDLHASQMQGFFNGPIDNLFAEPSMVCWVREHVPDWQEAVVVSKNAGGVKRVTSLADKLHINFALIHTDRNPHRQGPYSYTVRGERISLVGSVRGRVALLVDDMIDGTRSFLQAADHLVHQCGAKAVYILATHGILSGNALHDIEMCPTVDRVVVTNTIPISSDKRQLTSKLEVIDVSSVLAEAIRRTHNGESVSFLFDHAL